jgi:hypothetical protein
MSLDDDYEGYKSIWDSLDDAFEENIDIVFVEEEI